MKPLKDKEIVTIQAERQIRSAVQPARDPSFTPETRGMCREHYETENVFLAAIQQAEQSGSLNPRLADSLNELAIVYAKQHKFEQAERMFQRSLGVSVAALGSDHPDVAIILKNIGILKAIRRQYAEAELLLGRSLSLTHRTLGHEHPTLAVTMRTIALFQAAQGHHEEAERFIRRSLEISEKTLGAAHPETAASRKVFAQIVHTGPRDREAHQTESRVQDENRICCGS